MKFAFVFLLILSGQSFAQNSDPNEIPQTPQSMQNPGAAPAPKAVKRPPVQKVPAVPAAPRVPVPPPERPAPAPRPVSDSAKSSEQREYEAAAQQRINNLAQKINELDNKSDELDDLRRRNFRDMLNTCAGNRSVVRTKVKQLKFIPPNQWQSLRNGIEKAFVNLEQSIARAEAFLNDSESRP